MVPYLHVRFPIWKGKITSYLFWLCMKTCLKCCQFDQILYCQHFLDGKKNFFWMGRKATGPPEGAAISTPKSHSHVNCSKKTKVGWWRLNLIKYAMGPLSGQVFGSKKVTMPNSCKGNTSRERCPFWACRHLPTCLLTRQPPFLPERLLQRTPEDIKLLHTHQHGLHTHQRGLHTHKRG